MNARMPLENTDTIGLVCALLVRFPEIASLRSMPGAGTVRLTFAVAKKLDATTAREAAAEIKDHVFSFVALHDAQSPEITVDCEFDRTTTFLHVSRDLDTFTKDELGLVVALVSERFSDALVRNPTAEHHPDEDPSAQDELVEVAIEALRDPAQSKSLVGFREEKRVLVYFLKKSAKKAKASARR